MTIKSLIILVCYLLCYYPPSVFLLRYFGVTTKVHERALIFGVSVGGLILLPPVLLLLVSAHYGAGLGIWVGVVLAYLYMGRVLTLQWYEKAFALAGLPLVAGILSLPLIYFLGLMG